MYIGKVFGVALGLRVSNMSWKQFIVVGFALNARGAMEMEMILATVAKDAELIDDRLFVALIIMALVTSVLSGPIMSKLNDSHLEIGNIQIKRSK